MPSTTLMNLKWGRNLKWIREEGLANVAAEFIDLLRLGGEKEESFIGNSQAGSGPHNFPQYVINVVKRFAKALTPLPPLLLISTASAPTLTRDPFGFRQGIVAATMPGKVYGLDLADGIVLWSHVLGLVSAGTGRTLHVAKIFLVDDLEGGDHWIGRFGHRKASGPRVMLVAQRRAKNTLVEVDFHVVALTGGDVSGVNRNEIDDFIQVYLYPSMPSTQSLFKLLAPSLHFPLPTPHTQPDDGTQGLLRLGSSDQVVVYPTWTLSFPEGKAVKTMVKPHRGQVASIGKVLANQTTLYKYLNPRLFVLITESGAAAGVSTEPTGTGTEMTKQGSAVICGRCGKRYSGVTCGGAGCYWAGVGLAGDAGPDEAVEDDFLLRVRMGSSDMSSYSSKSMDVMAIEQAYVFPFAITTMAPTSTKFGITNKDLIAQHSASH
ncbi:hypothetical protein L208DRAFT_1378999 [Tricholoma matsutake]|nr:hypothetical protein L208DRAFT_1378999 [Tricholoma matsutake 945]